MERITWHLETRKLSELRPYYKNPRDITEEGLKELSESFDQIGLAQFININTNGTILSGHARWMQLVKEGVKELDVLVPDRLLTSKEEEAVIIRMNKNISGKWNYDILANQFELEDLLEYGFTEEELHIEIDDINKEDVKKGSLSDDFGIAPFSILNAREGWWQDRKRMWIGKGLRSEIGRGDNLLKYSDKCNIQQAGGKPYELEKSKYGKCPETGIGEKYGKEEMNGTSIFDPVLCEIAYRWFCKKGGLVVDPFAGGSVRGIIASFLEMQYIGIDLRQEQVDANRLQAQDIINQDGVFLVWHTGDSKDIIKIMPDVKADLVFSCPPYADLEVYSDNPNDLSTMEYNKFKEVYFEIIKNTCSLLKEDSFACFVVGEVRDKKGNYYNFVSDTIEAFVRAGLSYYNEMILITTIGSLPIRSGRVFRSSRKIGKTHQNVLVFVKGDGKKASAKLGECSFKEVTCEEDL